MPSAAYNTKRAAAQNQPIELYELMLSNGVTIRLNGSSQSKSAVVPNGPHRINRWYCKSYSDNEDGPRPGIGIWIDQPLLRSSPIVAGTFPYKLRMVSQDFYPDPGDATRFLTSPNSGIALSTSGVPGSVKLGSSLVAHSPVGAEDGAGWGDAAFAMEGKGSGNEYVVCWARYKSVSGHNQPRSLVYSKGKPGSMSSPAYWLTSSSANYGNYDRLGAPAIGQYVDDEGEEVEIGGVTYWRPEYAGTPNYSYFILWTTASNYSSGYREIWWSGKNGMHTDPFEDVSANREALWGGSTSPGNEWRYYGPIDPFCFRKKGSQYIHVVCSGKAQWSGGSSYKGIGYNRYDCSAGTWKHSAPECIIGGDLQTGGGYYFRPQLYWNPLDGKYYLIVFDTATGANNTAHAILFVNDDIDDEGGWEEQANIPPEEAFGSNALAASNLFNVYSDDDYDTYYWTFPVKRDNIKRTSDDSVNTCTLYFSNVEHQFTQLLTTFDLRMSRVRIKRSFQDLDLDDTANIVTVFEGVIDEYALTGEYCRVVAKETLLNWDMQFPRRGFSTVCGFQFKGAGCDYAGPETFCDKTYESCTYYQNTTNFGGFCDAAVKQHRHSSSWMRGRGSGFGVYDV